MPQHAAITFEERHQAFLVRGPPALDSVSLAVQAREFLGRRRSFGLRQDHAAATHQSPVGAVSGTFARVAAPTCSRSTRSRLRRRIGYVFSGSPVSFRTWTVAQNIAITPRPAGLGEDTHLGTCRRTARACCGLDVGYRERMPHQLSGGGAPARSALARAAGRGFRISS